MFKLLVDILMVQFSRFDEIKDTFSSPDVVTTDSLIDKVGPLRTQRTISQLTLVKDERGN